MAIWQITNNTNRQRTKAGTHFVWVCVSLRLEWLLNMYENNKLIRAENQISRNKVTWLHSHTHTIFVFISFLFSLYARFCSYAHHTKRRDDFHSFGRNIESICAFYSTFVRLHQYIIVYEKCSKVRAHYTSKYTWEK